MTGFDKNNQFYRKRFRCSTVYKFLSLTENINLLNVNGTINLRSIGKEEETQNIS